MQKEKKKKALHFVKFHVLHEQFLVENFNFTWFTLRIYEIAQLAVAIKMCSIVFREETEKGTETAVGQGV